MLTDERIAQVEAAIAALGGQWSNRLVYEHVGGNYEALAQYLKARRAQAHEETAVAVAVEAPPVPPPEPPSPLARARAHRDQTAQAEHALALDEGPAEAKASGARHAPPVPGHPGADRAHGRGRPGPTGGNVR